MLSVAYLGGHRTRFNKELLPLLFIAIHSQNNLCFAVAAENGSKKERERLRAKLNAGTPL